MTRGQCGSLHLHRMTLSFTTPHRFSSALSDVGSKTTWHRLVIFEEAANGDMP
jgi:hypothetical protein